MKKVIYVAATVSIIVAVVGLGFLLYPKITDLGYTTFQKSLEAEDGENGGSLPSGVVCELVIPEIDLKTYVLNGTDQGVLKKGSGHYEETPLPGENGNCAIAGHRTMYGHPFRNLDKLSKGDEVIAYTPSGKHVYRIIEKKAVRPTDLSVVDPTEEAILTLTTCHPVGSARQRLVVVAEIEEG